MGCSPSKGKLFSKPPNTESENPPLVQDVQEHFEIPEKTEENGSTETTETMCQRSTDNGPEKSPEESNKSIQGENETKPSNNDVSNKTEKRKKNKDKQRANRHRRSSSNQAKFEFPPQMIRAHQAAYSYLNPNVSKYETLLGLLDQAAQTQLSLQPMMSALVMRFEEINQALEEMAEEGELMLKEHGEYMSFPSGMLGSAMMPTKSKSGTVYHIDPPPDLLQQLLHHSTEKMRLVGGSAQALGDTSLQEATDYYSSLSRVLEEKLQTKQAVERRLTLVLARVEVAAMRKTNPEDGSLHSEDSGIGGENESLTGSEKHRRHRGSAGSGSSGSVVHLRNPLGTPPYNSSELVEHNEDDEVEEDNREEDEEDEEEEDEDEDDGGLKRERSNSSPPDPCHAIMYMRAKYIQQMKPTIKRPMTATAVTKSELSSSRDHANISTELQRSQRKLDQRIKEMANMKELAGPHYDIYRSGLRRNSLSGSGTAPKVNLRISLPGTLPMIAPQPPKQPSVRRLINTFSLGVDGRPGQSLANVPHNIRGPRKVNEDGNNGNNNNNSWPESKDDMDVDNLPPPPPEVLMDDSFQSMTGVQRNREGSVDDSLRLPVINQKPVASQRLRGGIQNVELLPNRHNMGPRCHPNTKLLTHNTDYDPDLPPDLDRAESKQLNYQACEILHLQNASVSNSFRSPLTTSSGILREDMAPILPITAPPVSRVRLPPSCPSVCQRHPSPPVCRPPSQPSSLKTEEIFPSVSFKSARSVFCQGESQNDSRGRTITRRNNTNVRRIQSEQPTSRK